MIFSPQELWFELDSDLTFANFLPDLPIIYPCVILE